MEPRTFRSSGPGPLACGVALALLVAGAASAAPSPRFAEAERRERALGKDPQKLRYRHNIEGVAVAWREAARDLSGDDRADALEGELRALELLAHWSGTPEDKKRRDRARDALADARQQLTRARPRSRDAEARPAVRAAPTTLTRLEWALGEGEVEVTLPRVPGLKVAREALPGQQGAYFDLSPLVAEPKALGVTRLDHPLVTRVRVGQFRKDTVRIVVELAPGAFRDRNELDDNVRATNEDGRVVVRIAGPRLRDARLARTGAPDASSTDRARSVASAAPPDRLPSRPAVAESGSKPAEDADPLAALLEIQQALDRITDEPHGASPESPALDALVEQLRVDPDEPSAAPAEPAPPAPGATQLAEESPPMGPPEPPPAGTREGLARSTREAMGERRGGVTRIRRVVIDAGHGGKDTGAIGKAGVREKDVNLAIAKELARVLQDKLGVDVVLTRSKDTYVGLAQRVQIANRADADLFVSVHSNAHRNRKFTGIETYYLNTTSNRYAKRLASRENAEEWDDRHLDAGDPHEPIVEDEAGALPTGALGQDLRLLLADLAMRSATEESRRLAGLVQSTLVGTLRKTAGETVDLGVKHALFFVLLGSRMPSVLVESGFLSNAEEERRLADPAHQRRLAQALATGIQRYVEDRGQVATRR